MSRSDRFAGSRLRALAAFVLGFALAVGLAACGTADRGKDGSAKNARAATRPSGTGRRAGSGARSAADRAAARRRRTLHRRLRLPIHPIARTVRVPILMYHRVHVYATELTKSQPELTVEPSTFAAEIRALAHAGYHSVTVAQLHDALFHGAALPRRPVMLTFDDGYVDDVKDVLPVLRARRMTGVMFIITSRFHEPGFVTPTQIRRLDAAGMDIGAHTRNHVDLPGLPTATLDHEIAGSRRDLERVVRHPIAAFAYPAGRFDSASADAVRRAGFALAVTTQPGTQLSSLQPLELPRVRVNRTTTPAALLGCVQGRAACG